MHLSSIVIAMVFMLAVPLTIAWLFNVIQSLRRATSGEALAAQVLHDPAHENWMVLELVAGPGSRAVSVERIIVDREFAARVLAQPPRGFRERHPVPPPSYDAFEPDLTDMRQPGVVDPRTIEAEKRRQHTDLLKSWADMCEATVTWEGRLTVRRGVPQRLLVPMRTDVAATGRITIIHSYRVGFTRTTSATTSHYRPRLVAVHG
jgi:hypothetical protein